MEYLLRKAAGSGQSQPKREACWAAAKQDHSVSPFGAHISPWVLDVKLQDLVFAQLGFSLAFVPLLHFMSLFLPVGMGVFTPCHWMWDICNLLFYSP